MSIIQSGGDLVRIGRAKKTIQDDLLIIKSGNATGDLIEMHKTRRARGTT